MKMELDDEDFSRWEPDPELNRLAHAVIGAAIEVHKQWGPGLTEGLYEAALCSEMRRRRIPFVKQPIVPVMYKDELVGECRLDLLVDGRLIIELKAVSALDPLHTAQVITYLKVMKLGLALLINFNTIILKDGIKRIV